MRISLSLQASLLAAVAALTEAGALHAAAGLSPVGALFLENPAIGNTIPEEGDGFGSALVAADFNGDGRDDLAVGVPYDNGVSSAPAPFSGAVIVYFGEPGGTLSQPRRLGQVGTSAESGDLHGYALAAGDFDDDGFADLVVGASEEDLGATNAAGAVFVYPGAVDGPVAGDFLLFTQETAGIPEGAEEGDRFGGALAVGDFDGDGFDDLAIAAYGETLNGNTAAGWVVTMPGSAAGLDPAQAFGFSQFELPGEPETTDGFGLALAAGDWDGDLFDDLAIGAPGEDGGIGAVHVMFGGASGVTPAGSAVLDDFVLGGFVEEDDRFGDALAFGDFDGDGFDDLVVGVPAEDVFVTGTGNVENAGQVVVAYGHAAIPAIDGVQHWRESQLLGVEGTNNFLGAALAAGDFDGDGFDELAIGLPGDNVLSGAAVTIGGSVTGLDAARVARFSAGLAGVPGVPPGSFGFALAAGDLDGDGHADLASGSPAQDIGEIQHAGAATILFGALFADGFESEGTGAWVAVP